MPERAKGLRAAGSRTPKGSKAKRQGKREKPGETWTPEKGANQKEPGGGQGGRQQQQPACRPKKPGLDAQHGCPNKCHIHTDVPGRRAWAPARRPARIILFRDAKGATGWARAGGRGRAAADAGRPAECNHYRVTKRGNSEAPTTGRRPPMSAERYKSTAEPCRWQQSLFRRLAYFQACSLRVGGLSGCFGIEWREGVGFCEPGGTTWRVGAVSLSIFRVLKSLTVRVTLHYPRS